MFRNLPRLSVVAIVAALALCPLAARAAAKPATDFAYIADHRQSLVLQGLGKKAPAKRNELWFAMEGRRGLQGFEQWYVSPGGAPLVPDTSTMVAANIGCAPTCVAVETNGSVDVQITAGAVTFSGSLPAGTNTIGGVQLVPVAPNAYPSAQAETITQLDFSNGTAGCVAAYNGQSPARYPSAPIATNKCYIVKVGAGLLLAATWQGLNAVGAGINFQCFDNATAASGRIVWQGQNLAAGQYKIFEVYGRPFANGLTCASSATTAGDPSVLELATQ
jgi:hypothetical protein